MGPAAKPRKTTKKKGSVSKQSLKETATKSDYDRLATTIIRSKTSKSTKNTTIKIVPQLHLPKISVQIDADQMGIYCINKKLKIITCGRHVKSTLPPPVFDILQQPMNSAVSGDLLFDGSRYFVRVHGTSRSAFFDAIQSVLAHRKYILKIPLTQQEHFYFLSNGSKRFDPGQFDDVLGPNQHLTSYVVTGKCAKAYTDDIEMRTHTTKTGVTKAYPKTKRGERGNADMYSQIINTEKISYATIEKARLRQRLKKLKTIDASKKRPCRILSSSSDSSHSSTDNSTDEDVENSTEHGETEEDESQQGTASEGTSSTIESPETSPQQIFSPGPPPDDPPPYIEKKMRLKNRQISPPKETSPTCDLEPIIPTLLPSTIVDSPGKSIPSNPGTTSALGNPLLPLCRPRDELSPTALTFMPFQINDVPASITGISGSMLERIDALRDYMSFLNTYLAQIENKEELSPINTSNTIIRSAHEYVSWLQRMAHYFNIPSLPEGLVAKVVQLNESISSCGTDEPPFVPFGTLINFVQAIMTNGGRLRTAIYEALKKQYCTPPRKVKMVEPTTGEVVEYIADYVEKSPETGAPIFEDPPSPSSSSDKAVSDEGNDPEASFVYWSKAGPSAPRKMSYGSLDPLIHPATGKIPQKECADAIKKLRPTLSRDAKLARLNTSTRKIMAGVKRSMDTQTESFDDFIQDYMDELLSRDEFKDDPVP